MVRATFCPWPVAGFLKKLGPSRAPSPGPAKNAGGAPYKIQILETRTYLIQIQLTMKRRRRWSLTLIRTTILGYQGLNTMTFVACPIKS